MVEHECLKRRPKQVHHHIIIRILTSHLYYLRNPAVSNSIFSLNLFDDLGLIVQFRLADRPHLDLDGNNCLILGIDGFEDLVKWVET